MWKASLTETGIDALLGGGTATALALGPETMGASIAMMGLFASIKGIKH